MVLGLSLAAFTLLHVIISLVALLGGLLAAADLLTGRLSFRLQTVFLVTTVATSLTGFFFPTIFGPAHVIGLISLAILAAAIYALFVKRANGGWRGIYVVSAFAGLYFNVFVAVVQAFQKIPSVHTLAPTQKEAPFAAAQALVLLFFVVVTVIAYRRSRAVAATPNRRLASSTSP